MAHRAKTETVFSSDAPLNTGGHIVADLNTKATVAASMLATSAFSLF
ncbi:hypothetical protein [Ensifer adhaerens]|nr:hypothetical protein [Ensifer adhaerens]